MGRGRTSSASRIAGSSSPRSPGIRSRSSLEQDIERISAPADEGDVDVDDLSLREFAAIVRAELPYVLPEPAAEGRARGRFGDRKVFISALWRMLRTHPRLRGMTGPAFKQRLFEAHRARLLTLARADLVAAMDPSEVADSEYDAGGATFHFVVGE